MRRDQYRCIFPLVTKDSGVSDEDVALERVLDRLRSNELSARGLDQIFLAVGDPDKAVSIDRPDVSGMEPAVDKSVTGLFGKVPIAFGNGWPTHEQFTVVGDATFDVRQRSSDRAELVVCACIKGDDRRCFRQAI